MIKDKLNLFYFIHKDKIVHCAYFSLHAIQIFLIIKLI
jgi:hypothetical protein